MTKERMEEIKREATIRGLEEELRIRISNSLEYLERTRRMEDFKENLQKALDELDEAIYIYDELKRI